MNDAGERVWCKFHFKSKQGIRNMTDEESAETIGGDFPKWRVCNQVMTQAQADSFRWNPFDLTRVWSRAEFPLIEIGELELNRNPENYFAEVEQADFKPSAFVPGIGASPDKMFQARLMSYADTHLHRLGVNHHQIPVNRPRCPVMHSMRDGQQASAEGYGARPNYWPNSVNGAAMPEPAFADPAWNLGSAIVDRYDSTVDHDDFTQPGNLYRMFDDAHRDRLTRRIAGVLGQARREVQLRQLCHFFRADEDYGTRVAAHLGIDVHAAMAELKPEMTASHS